MSELKITGIADFANRLDARHEMGVALLWHGGGYAFAVVKADTGDVLAWDGWYFEERPAHAQDVRQLAWAEWDDMPSKLLHTANAPWLGGALGFWLMPTYSPAVEAGSMFAVHRDSATDSANRQQFREADVCAYLPIVDDEAFWAEANRKV